MTHTLLRPVLQDSLGFLSYLHERAVHHVPDRADRVLDVGAGEGDVLRRLQNRCTVIALDILPRTGHPGEVAGDVASIPARDASFDAVVCINVLTSIEYRTARDGLAEMARVLRPGGRLILSAPNLDHPLVRLRTVEWKRRTGNRRPSAYRVSWIRDHLLAMADVEAIDWILPYSISGKPLAAVYAALAQRVPRLSPHWLLVAKRK